MEQLIEILRKEGCSCVVQHGSEIRRFHQRGVADLLMLVEDSEQFLKDARVADKVIGKGAAALLIVGKVAQLHAEVISQPALTLLERHGVASRFEKCVPFIVNRRGDGQCPVEALCAELDSPDECLVAIRQFLSNAKRQNSENSNNF